MTVVVNGEGVTLPAATTVADLVGDRTRGVAVAVNDEVVPRSEWEATRLRNGDRVEVLEGRQGG